MCFLNTYKVQKNLAGLEASLTRNSRQTFMLLHHTYKVQKNLAGLEPQRNRMGNIADKQHKLYTYKVKIDLAGLEASLTGNSRQTTMF